MVRIYQKIMDMLSAFPEALLLLIARIGIAATFWMSGQTKIDGFVLNLLTGEIKFGWPTLTSSARYLFREEYRLPVIPSDIAALMAASAEHLFPFLIFWGIATRFSALALIVMTLIIQIFVYPDAYPTHAVWLTALLLLLTKGAGKISIDHWFRRT